ncbi:hypothetical protein [Halopseudomonas formosensis]|uniref:Lipoprotein n=1 Tax=Halopseudomonas formosensis TaxID=1002526 RepID=A0ABU5C1A0_9GAMM|nr:hypothetical protein [Halopseudomonas formosensis]MDX9688819.1 hypothetical protein [Halopseudomonas formosensis]
MSYIKVIATLAAATTLLVGCATTPSPAIQAKRAELEATTPICVDEQDCKAKWEAAQLWIVRNAGFKLQITTDVLLQTYNATGGSPLIAVQATKEPLGGGKYKIVVAISCDNIFGCVPNQWDAALAFNHAVAAATP